MSKMIGEQSIVIQASAQKIYGYVSDFPKHIEWNHQPQEMTKITDGPISVGSVFRAREDPPSTTSWFMTKVMFPVMSMIMGVKGYTQAEITAMEPDQRLAWKASAPARNGDMMRAEWEIVLEPQSAGTKVTQRFQFMPQQKMVDKMANDDLAQQIGDEVARNLELLKTKMESGNTD